MLTAREWETNLATAARATSAVRLVARAYEPSDVVREVDVVVAGAETTWVTPSWIKSWANRGVRVLGLFPPGDRPAQRMLERANADEIWPDDTASLDLVNLARAMGLEARRRTEGGRLIVVTGAHGAPGRTETAVCLAHALSAVGPTLLLDLDTDAPSVSMRLGLPPFPSMADIEDILTVTGDLPPSAIQHSESLSVLTGDLTRRPSLESMLTDIARAATRLADTVIVDARAWSPGDELVAESDVAILVCDASPVGLIRGAEVALRWSGPAPHLILNRVPADADDVLVAARRAIGLEPTAIIPERTSIRTASRLALPPPAIFRSALGPLASRLGSSVAL